MGEGAFGLWVDLPCACSLLWALFGAVLFRGSPGFVGYDEVGCFSEVFFGAGYFGAGSVWSHFSFHESDDSV